jgi:SMODS and SLOG-associating 2TM effector domain family 4
MNKNLLSTARFYFAQSVFLTTCHYKAFNRLTKKQGRNNYIVMSISGATLILIILQMIGLKIAYQELLEILSYCGLILTGSSLIYTMFNMEDISEIKNQHKNIAEEYKSLRDKYMGLIEEIMSTSKDEVELRKKRDEYQKAYSAIGKYAPSTTCVDYVEAQKGLGINGEDNEEFTWSNKEIDNLLPCELRIEENIS